MKIWSNEYTFNDPWETVIQAAMRKYPNPFKPEVHGIDVLDRKLENGVLKSHRLITTRWNIPSWGKAILGNSEFSYGSEHSEVDPAKKTMTMRTRNISWAGTINIDELMVYRQHPANKDVTEMKQETTVTVNITPLSSYLEGIVTDSISKNAAKGIEAMEYVIDSIKEETRSLFNFDNPRPV